MTVVNKIDKLDLLLAGYAVFTLRNVKTNKHITYKVYRPHKVRDVRYVFVRKDHGWIMVGHIYQKQIFSWVAFASQIPENDNRFAIFNWFFAMSVYKKILPENIEFLPSDRCFRCGRELTEPESIKRNIGPKCIKYMSDEKIKKSNYVKSKQSKKEHKPIRMKRYMNQVVGEMKAKGFTPALVPGQKVILQFNCPQCHGTMVKFTSPKQHTAVGVCKDCGHKRNIV